MSGGMVYRRGHVPVLPWTARLSVRGSRTDTAPAAHLLAAVTGAGQTVTQLRVPDRTTEITGFTRLLAPFGLSGCGEVDDDPAGQPLARDRQPGEPPGRRCSRLHTCRRTRARTCPILARAASSSAASVRRAVESEAAGPNNGR